MLKVLKSGVFWYYARVFRGGAVVAQAPVKLLVVGSNPTRGAKKLDMKLVLEFIKNMNCGILYE